MPEEEKNRKKNPGKILRNKLIKEQAQRQLISAYESGEDIHWGSKLVRKMSPTEITKAMNMMSTQKGAAWMKIFRSELKKRKSI